MKKQILRRISALAAAAVTVLQLPALLGRAAQKNAAQASDEVGLVCNLFCTPDSDSADHAALQWATTRDASGYVLYRSTNAKTGFVPVYEGYGCSCEDDDLQVGQTYYYQLEAVTDKGVLYSDVQSLTPCEVPSGLQTYDNQKGSSLYYETGGYKVGDTYYSYSLKKHTGQDDILQRQPHGTAKASEMSGMLPIPRRTARLQAARSNRCTLSIFRG